MTPGPQYDIEAIKHSLQAAIVAGDLDGVNSIAQSMKVKGIGLSFMEQISFLEECGKIDAQVGHSVINCGVFRQELIFVGMTCLKNFQSNEIPVPINVPLMDKELIKAVENKRYSDVHAILRVGKWCIAAELSRWAANKATGITNSYDDLIGVEYVAKNYLPQHEADRSQKPIVLNPVDSPLAEKSRKYNV